MLDDTFALAISGKERTWNVLELALNYEDEKDFTVWSTLSDNLLDLSVVWRQYPAPNIVRVIFCLIFGLFFCVVFDLCCVVFCFALLLCCVNFYLFSFPSFFCLFVG